MLLFCPKNCDENLGSPDFLQLYVLHKDDETRMTANASLCSGVQACTWWKGAFTEMLHRCCYLHFIKCLAGLPWWLRQSRISLQCRRLGFNLWVRKIPRRRERLPTPVFFLENSMDRGTWWATVRGVTKSRTRLSNSNYYHYKCPPVASHSFSPSPSPYLQSRQTWVSFDLADPFHPCGYRCAQK